MSKAQEVLEKLSFYQMPDQSLVSEEWFATTKLSIPNKGGFEIFVNPTVRDSKCLGKIIRFTAYNKTKKVYAWGYDKAHHVDVSKAVGIKHSYNDPDLLTGAATLEGGKYKFSSSDALKDFKKAVSSETEFFQKLLSIDWSWADRYVEITPTIKKLKAYVDSR